MNLRGKRILVTGANGFLGTRLVEFLVLAHQADVRALVRSRGRSIRLIRLPVEIAVGDVRDEQAMQQAVDGCAIVIHCASALDAGRDPLSSTTFRGTEVVARAAQRQQVEKFVHVSSSAVFGSPGAIEVNESCPLKPRWPKDGYAMAKIAAEGLLLELCAAGLPATIVEPTMIYGPYSAEWSIHPLRILREADYILPAGGVCNPVYVDDVVRAIILAALSKKSAGERYLVSGAESVSWAQFLQPYAAMSAGGRVVTAGEEEFAAQASGQRKSRPTLAASLKRIAGNSEIRNAMKEIPFVSWSYDFARRAFSPERFLELRKKHLEPAAGSAFAHAEKESRGSFLPSDGLLEIYRARTRYSIGKAKSELAYLPQVPLDKGMQLTAEWARWARLVK